MMKFHLDYYRINADSEYELFLSTMVYAKDCNLRKSSEPKNNTCDLTLNNPIKDLFPDGKPKRFFVDSTKDSIFRATKRELGYESFEEKVEVYAKDVSDINEEVNTQDNLL